MSSGKSGSCFFGGLIIGSLIGIAVGFVLSRKSEEESFRGKLGDLVMQGREAIREAIQEGKEAAKQKESEFHQTESK